MTLSDAPSVARRSIAMHRCSSWAGKTSHACCVRDATNDGAGIRLNDLNILPFNFAISFDNFRTMRRCRLIWRNGDFVGVAFES